MGFRIKAKESASEGLARLARRQINKAVRDLSGDVENPDETIHSVRKRLKKVRALLRVVKPELGEKSYHRQDRRLRDVGRTLSEARDARVLVDTLQTLAEGLDEDLRLDAAEPVLTQLRDRAESLRSQVRDEEQWSALPSSLKAVRRSVRQWPLDDRQDWPVLSDGIDRIYRKGYQAQRRALRDTNSENLHDWRKRVKDLWHALELLRNVRPGFFESRVVQARELADLLGHDHDLSVLEALLTSEEIVLDNEPRARLKAKITDRRVDLQRQIFLHGPFVYDESPDAYLDRLEAYWAAWRAELHALRQPTR